MHQIKKYANRKLYDTTEKRYVSLTEIGELVRGGEEVCIVDNACLLYTSPSPRDHG